MRSPADSRLPRLAGWDGTLRSAPDLMPLAGVVFMMLVFLFVDVPGFVHGPLRPVAFTADLMEPDDFFVAIDRQGMFYVAPSWEPVPDRRLATALVVARGPDARAGRTLYLLADGDVEYGRVMVAMDAARRAGIRRVGALTARPLPPELLFPRLRWSAESAAERLSSDVLDGVPPVEPAREP